eukprot:snap_masked-scaffold_51-processed-gene-1.2-mRNA-1 protein AED:1.00 eAED:1.00 QI:0/-1/0/0/-1/1/1/0/364
MELLTFSEEEEITAPIKLRRSCTRCVTLKKKCDSMKPTCSRCHKLKSICSYEVSKKRGKKSRKTIVPQVNFSGTEKNMLTDLFFPQSLSEMKIFNVFNRRSVSVEWAWRITEHCVTSLAENYDNFILAPCAKIETYLAAKLLSTVTNFLKKATLQHIDVSPISQQYKRILDKNGMNKREIVRIMRNEKDYPHANDSQLEKVFFSFEKPFLYPLPQNLQKSKAFARVYWIEQTSEFERCLAPHFEVNQTFEEYFGFGSEFLKVELTGSVQSFLQFGANILSFLTSEDVINTYLKAFESQIKMNNMKLRENKSEPWSVVLPCSLIMKLETHSGEWKPFQVSALMRELVSSTKYLAEVRLYFTPCEI